jgi:hypothetical protein
VTKPAAFQQADLERALKASKAAGVAIARIVLEGGRIEIITGEPEPNRPAAPPNPWDGELQDD